MRWNTILSYFRLPFHRAQIAGNLSGHFISPIQEIRRIIRVFGQVPGNRCAKVQQCLGFRQQDSVCFRIEFFASAVPDSSGYGEGQTYLGFVDVTTDASGDASFSPTLTAAVPTGQVISATATRLTSGMNFVETSEFAATIYTIRPASPATAGLARRRCRSPKTPR